MATTEAVMGLTLPALNSDAGSWDTSLNLSLERIASHTHESGYGVRIKPAGLNINSDLTFAGNAATNLRAAHFSPQVAYASNLSLWVNSSNNDLYFRNSVGTDIRITTGSTLNLSIVGGITGDYAAAAAALYYDDGAEAYRFLEASPLPNDWSYVKVGGIHLYEHDSGISNYIGILSPSLAVTYSLTLPSALPASTVSVQVSSAGVMTFTNAHGDRVKNHSGSGATPDDATKWVVATNGQGLQSTAADRCFLCPEFVVGERVKSVSISRSGDAAVDCTFTVYVCNGATTTSIGTATANNITSGLTVIDLTDTTIGSNDSIVLEANANAANFIMETVAWTYDRPS